MYYNIGLECYSKGLSSIYTVQNIIFSDNYYCGSIKLPDSGAELKLILTQADIVQKKKKSQLVSRIMCNWTNTFFSGTLHPTAPWCVSLRLCLEFWIPVCTMAELRLHQTLVI